MKYELHVSTSEGTTIEPLVPVPVERLRAWLALAQERDHQAGWRPADAADPLVTALRDAVLEIYRLRTGLEGLRREHTGACDAFGADWQDCTCGAAEHNGRIDTLLMMPAEDNTPIDTPLMLPARQVLATITPTTISCPACGQTTPRPIPTQSRWCACGHVEFICASNGTITVSFGERPHSKAPDS